MTNSPKTKYFLDTIKRLIPILLIAVVFSCSTESAGTIIPSTGNHLSGLTYATSPNASKLAFINSLGNGKPDEIVGLWLPGFIGLVVEKQPQGQPGYVSEKSDVVTRFQLADTFGSIGLLAHAHKAGIFFHNLVEDQIVTLIYGDGTTADYKIEEIRLYQSLEGENPQTSFKSTQSESLPISQEDLFYEVYAHPGRLVLQTCIIKGNDNLWGRKFIIATKVQ